MDLYGTTVAHMLKARTRRIIALSSPRVESFSSGSPLKGLPILLDPSVPYREGPFPLSPSRWGRGQGGGEPKPLNERQTKDEPQRTTDNG